MNDLQYRQQTVVTRPHIITDELPPPDLQQLSQALHVEVLKSFDVSGNATTRGTPSLS